MPSLPRAATPQMYKGLKPQTSEPWVDDALTYAEKIFTPKEAYNDESPLDYNNGYESHVTASSGHNAGLGNKPMWDNSPMRNCPHPLRGIKPMTVEPWAIDRDVYNADTTRDTTEDAAAAGGDEELAKNAYKDRATTRQVDRPGFYTPNWESWAAALSA